MKRSGKWLSILLSLFAIAGMLAVFSITASAEDGIPYVFREWDPQSKTVVSETMYCNDYTVMTGYTNTLNGWYVVNGNIAFDDRLEVSGEANIILCDGAKLYCEDGIHVSQGNTLRIYAQENGSGELYCDADSNYNAALGSDDEENACGLIIIYGGNITADTNRLGTDGAGIGGGNESSGGYVYIYGGSVNAIGGDYGAGIGSGDESGGGGTVVIYDGDVKATGGTDGAGIGGGNESDGAAVDIWGGTVTATAGSDAAGIGGGDEGNGARTTIYGGEVTAKGGKYGAGIGGGDADGDGGLGGDIIINDGTVTATGGANAAGIGGGEEGTGGTIKINGGDITVTGGENGSGIGGGKAGAGGTIKINGGDVTANGGENGAGIGGGSGKAGAGGTIEINAGNVTATGGTSGAGIGGGKKGAGSTIKINGGDVTANGGTDGAGIGGGEEGAGGIVSINKGNVTANGGTNGAGIGGGEEGAGATVSIYEGDVIATGGEKAAGIGSGNCDGADEGGDAGTVTIEGGRVNATGGKEGAGIGGGLEGTGAVTVINGGTVIAEGKEYGSGIGSGYEGSAEDITINGGDVTAITRGDTACIGGFKELTKTIRITGGKVTTKFNTDFERLGPPAIGSVRDMNGTIIISGGTVNAYAYKGAAIGGGYGYNMNGTITISGGNVKAKSGNNDDSGAAIGAATCKYNPYTSFYDGGYNNGTINITGGIIRASVEKTAEAIGSGVSSDSSKMTLNIADRMMVSEFAKDKGTLTFGPQKASERSKCCHGTYVRLEPCTKHELNKKDSNCCKYCNYTVYAGYNLSLGGDIGLIYYLDITDKQAENKSADFTWDYVVSGELKQQSFSGELMKDDVDGFYIAACPVPAAEMIYGITASVTIDGKTYTDKYSVSQFADTILTGEGFAKSYAEYQDSLGNDGKKRLEQVRTLIKAMLDYGSCAQVHFDRNPGTLANSDFVKDDKSSPYYYDPYDVSADMINTGSSDMYAVPEEYGLEYEGSTIVYLSKTSMRHYYKITDQAKFDAVKDSITFEGEKCGYTEKDGKIYFELQNISAPDLDTLFALKIGSSEFKYSALDYVKECLSSNDAPESLKALAAATYRYNKAANIFFGEDNDSTGGNARGASAAETVSADGFAADDLSKSGELRSAGVEAGDEHAVSEDEYESQLIGTDRKSINTCTVSGIKSKTYTGKACTQNISVKDGSILLKNGTDYTVSYRNNKNAGKATVIVTGIGDYKGMITNTFKISKAENPLKVRGKTAKVRYSKLNKASQALSASKVLSFKKKGKGTMTYAKLSGDKAIRVSKKTGKVTVNKGLKKGTYKVKVKVTAKGNKNFKSGTQTGMITIKVK